jgi:hypothetical protein
MAAEDKTLTHYIAVGANVWGRAGSIREAIKNARDQGSSKLNKFLVYKCGESTAISLVDGGLSWLQKDHAPVALGEFDRTYHAR